MPAAAVIVNRAGPDDDGVGARRQLASKRAGLVGTAFAGSVGEMAGLPLARVAVFWCFSVRDKGSGDMDEGKAAPRFLTTREVASMLRVKERKVYDLAAAGEIPHRRMTGKLLFPAEELEAWIEGSRTVEDADRPAVIAGSHDPLLEWAIHQSECGLATLFNGSLDGLASFTNREAMASGLHLQADDGWNVSFVREAGARTSVLLSWAVRSRGLLLAPELEGRVRRLADLAGMRIVMRQPGAGARKLFEAWLEEDGLSAVELRMTTELARTEAAAAAAVAGGEADAAAGIESMARSYRLAFLPRMEERFDLLVDRRGFFTAPFQTLMKFAAGPAFRAKAGAMGGYDVSQLGEVRWLSR